MSLAAPTTVNCTSCGAGLDVLGGGRVLVHVCPYCGAELDAQDDYRVIAKFEGMKRPDSPFRIGMRGNIHGADYTVIGTLEYTEHWRGQTDRWIDHQLYSPTHGYAWLTLEDGHLVFTRRFRRPVWMSERRVETADSPPTVRVDGQTYRYYETFEAEITFVEGEFTWAPRLGDRVTTITAMSSDAMLGFSQTGQEREVYRTTLLDRAETAAAFGVPDMPRAGRGIFDIHPLTPYTGPNDGFLRKVGLIGMATCFALAMLFDTREGRLVGDPVEVAAHSLPATVPVTLPDTPGPTRVSLDGTPHVAPLASLPPTRFESFARISVAVTGEDGGRVAGIPSDAQVMIGGQPDGQPPGADNHTALVFPPAFAGRYQLQLDLHSQGPNMRDVVPNPDASQLAFTGGSVTIRTHAGMSDGYWLYRLGLVFLAIVLFTFAKRLLHHALRWKGSDWTSED